MNRIGKTFLARLFSIEQGCFSLLDARGAGCLRSHFPYAPLRIKENPHRYNICEDSSLKATTRFELVIRVLQTRALPLGYVALL